MSPEGRSTSAQFILMLVTIKDRTKTEERPPMMAPLVFFLFLRNPKPTTIEICDPYTEKLAQLNQRNFGYGQRNILLDAKREFNQFVQPSKKIFVPERNNRDKRFVTRIGLNLSM